MDPSGQQAEKNYYLSGHMCDALVYLPLPLATLYNRDCIILILLIFEFLQV